MKDLRGKAHKLLYALCKRGDRLDLEEKRFWSMTYERMITKYIISRKLPGMPRERLFESYSAAELVRFLADMLKETEA